MTAPAVLMRDFTRNDALEAIDRGHLARMTFGDRSLEREVLGLFDRQAALLIERMRGGEPAAVASLAHTLKGSAAGIGADRVARTADAAEIAAGQRRGIARRRRRGRCRRLRAIAAQATVRLCVPLIPI